MGGKARRQPEPRERMGRAGEPCGCWYAVIVATRDGEECRRCGGGWPVEDAALHRMADEAEREPGESVPWETVRKELGL